MKLTSILQSDKLSLSFEVFPPKTDTAIESVECAIEQIAALKPPFMSVTYGAGGGTGKYTLEIAKRVKETYNVPMLAHLTCVSSSKQTVHAQIEASRAAGIENVMALRGDIPAHLQDADRSDWDYHHAIDLVRELRESGADFALAARATPRYTPRAKTKRKICVTLPKRWTQAATF